MTTGTCNLRNPAVKRILQEAKELAQDACYEYEAHPREDDIFDWHFTVRGPADTEFAGGKYHGRILIPAEYPFKPPELMFLTPNGRFELNSKICLSITGYHPEYWQPAWGIRTVILAVMAFFPTEARGALGGLDYDKEYRRSLANASLSWTCPICCKSNNELLSDSASYSTERDTNLPSFALSYKPLDNGQDKKLEAQHKSPETNHVLSPKRTTVTEGTPSSVVSGSRSEIVTDTDSNGSRSRQERRPPIWLDGIITVLVAIIIASLIRRWL